VSAGAQFPLLRNIYGVHVIFVGKNQLFQAAFYGADHSKAWIPACAGMTVWQWA
jgi:hypothetical protein